MKAMLSSINPDNGRISREAATLGFLSMLAVVPLVTY